LALTSPEDIEQGIEHFAAGLPAQQQTHYLMNANPLHIDLDGSVRD